MSDMDDDELKATRRLNGADKYSEADEMFEKLGYKKYDNHPEHDLPPEPNMWSTQDMRRLYYEQKAYLNDGRYAVEHIEFDLIRKNVVSYSIIDGKLYVVPLNMQELLAINKKCEELRWL